MNDSWMVMIAGAYRSGTGDDPQKIAANLAVLEAAALEVWHRGHVPVIGEWVALPLIARSGGKAIGDAVWDSLGYPVADRLLEHCQAVYRLPGASKGADGDVKRGRELGLRVVTSLDELPVGRPRPSRLEDATRTGST